MSVRLEVRHGQAIPITSELRVSGTDGDISSSTVTTFELDGQTIRYSGAALPFRVGDEAIVSGFRNRDGVFVALAVRLPRQGLLLGGSSPWQWLFGIVFFTVGCGALLVLLLAIWGSLDQGGMPFDPIVLIVPLAIGCAFTSVGLTAMRNSERSGLARHLLTIARID